MKGAPQAGKLQSLYLNPGHLTAESIVAEPFHLTRIGQVPICSESGESALPLIFRGTRKISYACLRMRFSYK